MSQKQSSIIHSRGISTVEVGTITGEVEVTTESSAEGTEVLISYLGAKDVYQVEGSPLSDQRDHYEIVRGLAAEPKRNERGNVIAHTLG